MACNGDSTTTAKTFADIPGIMVATQLPVGVPFQAGSVVSLTGQVAAKAATTLFTPAADGFYRISIYAKVTTPATTSCALGGAGGVVITYTDPDGVAQTMIAMLFKQDGTGGTNNTTNTTASKLQGDVYVHAKAGVAIQYAIGYTSVGTTVMQYKAILKCEAL